MIFRVLVILGPHYSSYGQINPGRAILALVATTIQERVPSVAPVGMIKHVLCNSIRKRGSATRWQIGVTSIVSDACYVVASDYIALNLLKIVAEIYYGSNRLRDKGEAI
jgi:hypothetical protein